jgi:hypothetical protein
MAKPESRPASHIGEAIPMENTRLSRKRLTQILRHAILAYECELDNQGYESEKELHRVLLNEFRMTEEEYRKISKRRGGSKLSAYVHVVPDAEYEILQKYLDEGAVLVRQSVADEIKEKTGKSPAGLYLDGYDFGGEADVWIDVVRDKSHMAYDAIVCEIASEQREDSDADDS